MKVKLPEELARKIPQKINNIFDKFQKEGFEIYLIGAATRNLLLKKNIVDPDFTTNATPEEILKIFPEGFYDNIYGTVGIKIDGEVFEITTYRSERGYSDRRHPDRVLWGKTLEEDLSRREFTISAIAVGPDKSNQLEIIDLFQGQEDLLKNHLVQAIGDPEKRFSEDALRMIRAVRIATQLGLTIEPRTFQAIRDNATLINQIAQERIRDELFKILASDYPTDGVTLLFSVGLLDQIMPEITKGYGVQQAKHHIYDVWIHSLLSLKSCPSKDPLVRLATLLHDVGKPVVAKGEGDARTFYNHEIVGTSLVQEIAERLRLSKEQGGKLVTLVRWHQFTVDERQTDSAIRRFIKNVGKENLKDILDLRIGDRLGGGARETSWRLEKFQERLVEVQKQPFSVTDLKVDGHDVMKLLNITPGPLVGKILNELFNEVVEGKTRNEREVLLKRLKEIKNNL